MPRWARSLHPGPYSYSPRPAALESLILLNNQFGDEGLAALVAPPPPAGAPPTTTGGLTKLKKGAQPHSGTEVSDAGCATLAAALNNGALPALERLYLYGIPASAAARATVWRAGLVVLRDIGSLLVL